MDMTHTHEYKNVGLEHINSIPMTIWKCWRCDSKKYTPAGTVVRTFP